MEIGAIGWDLAKSVFHAHGADAAGAVVFRKQLRRDKVLAFLPGSRHALVAMEPAPVRTTGLPSKILLALTGRPQMSQ
jgi:transposase